MENVAYFAIGGILGISYALFAISVAVYAGRKGKKPYYKKANDEYEDGIWICPECGATVGIFRFESVESSDAKNRYCSNCGLKIDWRRKT